MNDAIKLSDLKEGDEIPMDAVISEMWFLIYPGADLPPQRFCLRNVPVAALIDPE